MGSTAHIHNAPVSTPLPAAHYFERMLTFVLDNSKHGRIIT
jgi:hypothetical protein